MLISLCQHHFQDLSIKANRFHDFAFVYNAKFDTVYSKLYRNGTETPSKHCENTWETLVDTISTLNGISSKKLIEHLIWVSNINIVGMKEILIAVYLMEDNAEGCDKIIDQIKGDINHSTLFCHLTTIS